MPAMNKDLLHQGFNFATACFDAGIDATPVTAWLSDQARLGIGAAPIAALTGNGAAGSAGTFDQAVLAAVRSSPAGVGMTDLRPILAHYGRPNNQIGAALGRLHKKNLIAKKGELWTAGKVDQSIDSRRRQRKTGATGKTAIRPGRATVAANTGEQQSLAATG